MRETFYNRRMSIPRFYCPEPLSPGVRIDLPDALVRHAVRVLRKVEGDSLILFNGQGGEYQARLVDVDRRGASAEILEWQDIERESPRKITLYQAVQSGDKMDLTIQKAVELGVANIVPLVSARSVLKLDAKRKEQRLERWRAIAISACEQCQRNQIPSISPIENLATCLANAPKNLRLLLNPIGAHSLTEILAPLPGIAIDILVGAEGGFTDDEIKLAESVGFVSLRFGSRILRTETAGLAVVSVIQHVWGDLN